MKANILKGEKKLLGIVLAVAVLLVSMFTVLTGIDFAAFAAEYSANESLWTGSTSDSGYLSDGSGTEGSPYIISTADQLVHLIRNCDSSAGKYYQLKEGVDFYLSDIKGLSGDELTTALQNASYSYNAKTFSGVLDGNGCTIYGLTRGSQYFGALGLFGAIDGATIKNLKIENAYISNQRDADNNKNGVLAVLAATANGACTIENVSVVDSTVLGDSYAGGLIGIQNGTVAVNNVIVANVALTGTNKNALCVQGVTAATANWTNVAVLDCIMAFPSSWDANNTTAANIYTNCCTDSYSRKNVTLIDAETSVKGADAKTAMAGLFTTNNFVAVADDYVDLALFHNMGYKASGENEHTYTCLDDNCGVIAGASQACTADNGVCTLCGQTVTSAPPQITATDTWDGSYDRDLEGEGTEESPYIISTAEEFMGIVRAETEYTDPNAGEVKYYKVADGVKVFDFVGTSPNGNAIFSGVLDGNGVTIKNYTDTNAFGNHGMFYSLDGATFKNIRIDGANFTTAAGYVNGGVFTGSVINNSVKPITFDNVAVINSTVSVGDGGFAAAFIGAPYMYPATTAAPVSYNNCLSLNNSLTGPSAIGAFMCYSPATPDGTTHTIKNSLAIGSPAYNFVGNVPEAIENVYFDSNTTTWWPATVTKLAAGAAITGADAVATLPGLFDDGDWVAMDGTYPDLAVFHNITYTAQGDEGHVLDCADDGCGVIASDLQGHNIVEGVCTECGHTHQHNYVDNGTPTTPAGCTTPGVQPTKCSCGDESTREIPATGHNFGSDVPADDPDCTNGGNIAYKTCITCGKNFAINAANDAPDNTAIPDVNLPADPDAHNWIAQTPIVSECAGVSTINYDKCDICGKYSVNGDVKDTAPSSSGHVLTFVGPSGAVCTSGGNIAYYDCDNCDKIFLDEAATQETTLANVQVDAINHANKQHNQANDPKCFEPGNIEYWYCPDCDANYSDEACTTLAQDVFVPAPNAHTPGQELGYDAYSHWLICELCGEPYDYDDHGQRTEYGCYADCSICGYEGFVLEYAYFEDNTPAAWPNYYIWSVSDAFDSNVEVKTEVKELDLAAINAANKVNYLKAIAYDIATVVGDENVEAADEATIEFFIDANYGDNLAIIYIDADGKVTVLESEFEDEDDMIYAYAPYKASGTYAVVEVGTYVEPSAPIVPQGPATPAEPVAPTTPTSPATGESAIAIAAIVVLLGGAALVLVRKFRKA